MFAERRSPATGRNVSEHRPAAGRIVILSDTHLGRPRAAACSAAALQPLWEGASRLIVNGDVAEVHHPDHWSDAARQTLHLHDLCEADGVELTLLSGNHDPYISDLRHLWLNDGRVFITHGDVLHPAVAPWSPVARRIQSAYFRALEASQGDERGQLEQRLAAAQHAAADVELDNLSSEARRSSIVGMLMRPWAVARVLRYWQVFPRLAERFVAAHAPQAKFAVFGHTHHPGVWTVNGRIIINTGSYGFPGSPLAVVLNESELSVWPIALSGGRYQLAKRPKAQFALGDAADRSTAIDVEYPAGQRPIEQA